MSLRLTRVRCLAIVLLYPVVTRAQHGPATATPATTLATSAPKEVQQLAFLVGQWELNAKPAASTLAQRIHGVPKLVGSLKAWRVLDGFAIEDEMRLTDASGNPLVLASSVRMYDPAAKQWRSSSLDAYRATFSTGTADARNGELVTTSQGVGADGKPVITRMRYFAITPASFKMQQDRSYDAGKTWTEGTLKIDAKRVAAAAPR